MNSLADTRSVLQFASAVTAPVGMTSKRIVDVVLALSAIVLLAPLLIICFVATILTSPGPALFRHRRVGFNGKYFDCLKFRTMVTDAPERLRELLESDPLAAAEWAANRKLRTIPGDRDRRHPAQVQPGRASPVVQRSQGRDEHCGTSSRDRRRIGQVFGFDQRLPCVPARNNWSLASQRPQHNDI